MWRRHPLQLLIDAVMSRAAGSTPVEPANSPFKITKVHAARSGDDSRSLRRVPEAARNRTP